MVNTVDFCGDDGDASERYAQRKRAGGEP